MNAIKNFYLILLGIVLILMPLHSVITAERVLSVALLIFYASQIISPAGLLKSKKILYVCAATTLLLGLSTALSTYPINFYEVFRLILIIWSLPFLKFCIDKYGTKKVIAISLFVLAIHGLWGITQFIFQTDLGFNILGESVLSVQQNGVAKFSVAGQKIIRAYGPYAHPNTFSSALLVGIILLVSPLWNESKKSKYFFGFTFLVALLTTFSRAALLSLFILVGVKCFTYFYLPSPYEGEGGRRPGEVNLKLFLISLIILTLFSPLYFFRNTDSEDRAVSERESGATWAVEIIKQNSWRGVGVGNYSEALKKYLEKSNIPHESWEIQPVHSVPLLLAAEGGIVVAALASAGYIAAVVFSIQKKKSDLLTLLLVFLPLILFDHYLATQTAPLLWMLLLTLLVM